MTIILQRRILNAILTIYLPTLLILCIVYATNFFKDFFFEAVVTVNLTGKLRIFGMFPNILNISQIMKYFPNTSEEISKYQNVSQRCWC